MFYIHICDCTPCVQYLWRISDSLGIRCPRTGVTDSCEHLCGCWLPNTGVLAVSIVVSITTKVTYKAFNLGLMVQRVRAK